MIKWLIALFVRKGTFHFSKVILALSLIVGLICFSLTVSSNQMQTAKAAGPTSSNNKYIVKSNTPDADKLDDTAKEAIAFAMNSWKKTPPKNNIFYLVNLRWEKTWAIATLTSADIEGLKAQNSESGPGPGDFVNALLAVTPKGWQASLEFDPNIKNILTYISDKELDQQTREILFPEVLKPNSSTVTSNQAYNNYKFPWASGQTWKVIQGWHDAFGGYCDAPKKCGIDIQPSDPHSDILASAKGKVIYKCPGTVGDDIIVVTDGTNEMIGYHHLAKLSGVNVGTQFEQGQKIGNLVQGSYNSDGCGFSTVTHLHFWIFTKPFTINGVTFDDAHDHNGETLPNSTQGNNNPAYAAQFTYQNFTNVTIYQGATAVLKLNAKNTGTATWQSGGSDPVRLGTNPGNHSSPFYSGTPNWDDSYRVHMDQTSVAPGETASFTIPLKAPANLATGSYTESFQLLSENVTWFADIKSVSINVAAAVPVGSGSGYPANYQDAYNRRGGADYFGVPTDNVSFYDSTGVTWQPLSGGSKGDAAIFHHESGGNDHASIRAYVVSGGIYGRYRSLNGPSSAYSAPTSDEFVNPQGQFQVSFSNGYMTDGSNGFHEYTWPSSCSGGWKRLVYNNAVLESGPSLVSCENYLNFDTDWSASAAGGGLTGQGIFNTNWSATYSRTENLGGGNYSFTVGADDGVRFLVDGTPQYNDWNGGGYREGNFQLNLSAGNHQFQLDYFQVSGSGRLKFSCGLATPSYTVGQGSGYASNFEDAYNRTGGESSWGQPTDAVKIIDNTAVAWQPLTNHAAIYHLEAGNGGGDPSRHRAFIVGGNFLDYYNSLGGPQSWLYTPTSDQFTNANGQAQINFYSGYLVQVGGNIQAYHWPTTADNWHAEYYNGLDLSGPALVRNEGSPGNLSFGYDWGAYAAPMPDQGLTFTENWSASWSRNFTFGPATYTFTLCGDDGVRLYLDNMAVIDQWQHQAGTCFNYTKNYGSAASVNLKIEYYQENGAASVSFDVEMSSHPATAYYVTNPQDRGSAVDANNVGTLSYALTQALPGDTIYLQTSVVVKGALPVMQPVVSLLGSCNDGPAYTIDGSDPSAPANGLTLRGIDYLYGVSVTHFRGKQLNIEGNQNRLMCVVVKKN